MFPISDTVGIWRRTVTIAFTATVLGLGGNALANAAESLTEETEMDQAEQSPEPPEKNTSGIMWEINCPFEDLINTKEAAVNLELSVGEGEGLNWHYLYKVICVEARDAVKSVVVGNTLTIGLTGAEMENDHSTISVFVVAWAVDENGRIMKTISSAEVNLHRKEIEAERKKDRTI